MIIYTDGSAHPNPGPGGYGVVVMDDNGKLVPESKVRGRKTSLDTLVKIMCERMDKEKTTKFFISHGDCLEDAEKLGAMVKEQYGVKDVFIYYVGAVIGSHSGPGTLALFFLGKHR